ncbi:MAG: response regulator transcription factor [bacterium]|nr:response regulator transcription factor [bacterium]
MKVHIADDSKLLRDRVKRLLEDIPGVTISGETENYKDTVCIVDRDSPDIVILDIEMPGGGINALRKIKQNQNPPLVIMFTNYPVEIFKEKCSMFGAEHFFCKSTEFDQLPLLLRKICGCSIIEDN